MTTTPPEVLTLVLREVDALVADEVGGSVVDVGGSVWDVSLVVDASEDVVDVSDVEFGMLDDAEVSLIGVLLEDGGGVTLVVLDGGADVELVVSEVLTFACINCV